jgi:HPt (histidine-containing phosphotransfer) domain-containing protein
MQGQADMFLARGFDAFISKPIDIRQLDLTINRLIRDRHPPGVVEAARRQKQNAVKLPAASYALELAKLFIRDAEKTIFTLESILARWNAPLDDDLTLYTVSVHSMKSALANIGEPDLSATALRLEQAGRERDLTVMSEETAAFVADLRAVVEKVRPKEEESAAELTDKDKAFLREQWLIIQKACGAYQKKTAKDALNALKERIWPRAVKEALDTVSEHLLHSDFEEAAAIAEREKEKMTERDV